MLRYPQWGWAAFSGGVSLILGIMLLTQPQPGVWLIGLFIGFDLLFDGASLIAIGLAVRRGSGRQALAQA